MALKLYYLRVSPPARAVLLTIRYLGLSAEIKNVDLFAQDHLTEEFLKINPAHQIPVLDDDGFIVTESRAIMAYLVNSRKPGSDLYPTDSKKRALVDQRLYFDATVVFPRNCAVIVSQNILTLVSTMIISPKSIFSNQFIWKTPQAWQKSNEIRLKSRWRFWTL